MNSAIDDVKNILKYTDEKFMKKFITRYNRDYIENYFCLKNKIDFLNIYSPFLDIIFLYENYKDFFFKIPLHGIQSNNLLNDYLSFIKNIIIKLFL